MLYTSVDRPYVDTGRFSVAVEYIDDSLSRPYYYERLRGDGPVWVPSLMQDSPEYDYPYQDCQDIDAPPCPMCRYYMQCRTDGPIWIPVAV